MKIRYFLFCILTGLSTATFATTSHSPSFNPQQVKDIQQIVHDYLINHPQVLVEASQSLQRQMAIQQQQTAQSIIRKNKQQLFNDANSPSTGNPQGDTLVVEFFDYQCGYCKKMNNVLKNIVSTNNQVKVIYKELPIFGAASEFAAKAALAANLQGKYQALHNALMAAANPLNKQKVLQLAQQSGVDTTQLQQQISSKVIHQELTSNLKLAKALRLTGTPAFIITNRAHTKFQFIPQAASQQTLEEKIKAVSQLAK